MIKVFHPHFPILIQLWFFFFFQQGLFVLLDDLGFRASDMVLFGSKRAPLEVIVVKGEQTEAGLKFGVTSKACTRPPPFELSDHNSACLVGWFY